MQTITEIEPNVDLIQAEQKKIYLVGTAHVSRTSADLVDETIRRYQPDTVCVELCDSRAQALDNPDLTYDDLCTIGFPLKNEKKYNMTYVDKHLPIIYSRSRNIKQDPTCNS